MRKTKVECPYGHMYDYMEEIPKEWPKGAPICPICCKNWVYEHPKWSYIEKLKQMSKVSKLLRSLNGTSADD